MSNCPHREFHPNGCPPEYPQVPYGHTLGDMVETRRFPRARIPRNNGCPCRYCRWVANGKQGPNPFVREPGSQPTTSRANDTERGG